MLSPRIGSSPFPLAMEARTAATLPAEPNGAPTPTPHVSKVIAAPTPTTLNPARQDGEPASRTVTGPPLRPPIQGGVPQQLTPRVSEVIAAPTPNAAIEAILAELQQESTTHARRLALGDQLAALGDPRPGVGVVAGLPDILWRPIPGGQVIIDEKSIEVAPFHMAAYPITVAQWNAFVQANDGYQNEQWWRGLERKPAEAAWMATPPNRPITNVSWFDAVAFCRWLSQRRGEPIRLPDEAERQWAAQSAESNFLYPWGLDWQKDAANTQESPHSPTTAVGVYPLGTSRQAVFDLAGNVWEWCEDELSNTIRVVRGGTELAGAFYRSFYGCDFRFRRMGFRVVCPSPIR